MFQYVWIILLAILYIAWIVKTIIDTVRHYKYDNDYDFFPDLYGGWSMVFIIVHVIVIFYLSVNYYYLYY